MNATDKLREAGIRLRASNVKELFQRDDNTMTISLYGGHYIIVTEVGGGVIDVVINQKTLKGITYVELNRILRNMGL